MLWAPSQNGPGGRHAAAQLHRNRGNAPLASKRIPKYQQIVDDLRRKIEQGALREGDQLPSYCSLMTDYQATVGVVRQSMQILQHEGLIHSIPRVGSVVARQQVTRRLIGVVLIGFPDSSYHLQQILYLHDDLDRLHSDLVLRLVESPDDAALDACCDWAQRCDGLLLSGRVPLRAALRMLKCGPPLVQIGELMDAPIPVGMSAVTVDVPSIARLAVSHLVGLGHRRIAFDSGTHSRYYQLLQEAFQTSVEEYGIADQCRNPGSRKPPPAAELVEHLMSLEPAPTAVLVEGGHRASRIVELLSFSGWPVPERISVMGITGSTEAAHVRPRLTCVLSSTQEMTLRAVEIVHEQLEAATPIVRVERCAPSYRPGETCRTLA